MRPFLALSLLPALLACSLVTRMVSPPAAIAAPTAIPQQPARTWEAAPTGQPPSQSQGPTEAITIREPGSGSRLVNAILLRGMVTIPTFENSLTARVVWDDGTDAIPPTPIEVNVQTATFDVTLPFAVVGERNAFILVYAVSPRDGGVTHLTSTGVRLAEHGANEVVITKDQPERLSLRTPGSGDVVSGGLAHIEGIGVASFEQTLLVEVLDTTGAVVGSQSVIVQAPDMGLPGTFEADVPYGEVVAGVGRIVVRDVSPAFGGDTHLASVEVQLRP